MAQDNLQTRKSYIMPQLIQLQRIQKIYWLKRTANAQEKRMKEGGSKIYWKFLSRNNFVQKAKTDFQYKIKLSTSVKFVTIDFDLVHRSCPSLSVMTAACDWHEAYNFRAILSNISIDRSHWSQIIDYLKDIVRGIFLKTSVSLSLLTCLIQL